MELQQLVDLAGLGGPENPWSSVGHETTVFGDHMGHVDNRTYLDADSHIMELPDFFDQLGFHRQLVFSTFAAPMCFNADSVQARYASAAAHNRGIAEFCADDDRLMGVGALPLDDSAAGMAEIEHMIDGRFERALDGHTLQALDRFYADNFSRVFGNQA